MSRYIPLIIVGLGLGLLATFADRYFMKISNPKTRKVVKIGFYVLLYVCMGCIVVEVLDWRK